MSTRPFLPLLSLAVPALTFLIVPAGCGSPAASDAAEAALSSDASAATVSGDASRKYAAIVGAWNALDAVPPASADGIASYTTYRFAPDGTFRASRSCRTRIDDAGACDATTTVTGTWQIFTTLPMLPRIDMTWSTTRESYVFSLQADLLVLDGIDALFQHDLSSLPEVADGAVCEDASWNSLARCPADIGDCDHETHRCLQGS